MPKKPADKTTATKTQKKPVDKATATKAKKTTAKTYEFKTEIDELLQLMIHSLYSNKDIFLRELISNASDACEKLRFAAINDSSLLKDRGDLEITIDYDEKAKVISIHDNGIGMSEEEVKTNLGTIAKSGTAEFLKQLKEESDKKQAQIIGQFGVGFYSSFMVANKVEVLTCKAGETAGVTWTSTGTGKFSIEAQTEVKQGTKIKLYLNEDNVEYADFYRLQSLIKAHSDYVGLPVRLKSLPVKDVASDDDKKDDKKDAKKTEAEQEVKFEVVNKAKALWLEPKRKVKDDEYKEFYKHITSSMSDPLLWSHNKVEGQLEYSSILYVPDSQPFDLWHRDSIRGLKLFVQRVFIMDKVEVFLPMYLRFVKGVIDSNDLDLNVSREILQNSSVVTKIKSALTSRVLDLLTKTATDDKEKYQKFWDEFGLVLKEGVAEEFKNKDQLLDLMRFSATNDKTGKPTVSFADYVGSMPEGQKEIYYLVADNISMAQKSPHLEVLKKKGIEVLLLTDKIDDWFIGMVNSYQDHALKNIAKGDLSLDDIGSDKKDADKDAKGDDKKLTPEVEAMVGKVKTALNEQVEDVKVSQRLTSSPCRLVMGENDLTPQMRKLMEMSGQAMPESKPILEINADHKLVKYLQKLHQDKDDAKFDDLALILLEQAKLTEEGALTDPMSFLSRINKFIG